MIIIGISLGLQWGGIVSEYPVARDRGAIHKERVLVSQNLLHRKASLDKQDQQLQEREQHQQEQARITQERATQRRREKETWEQENSQVHWELF